MGGKKCRGVTPTRAPPIKGEGKFCKTNVAKYLPLSAIKGEVKVGLQRGELGTTVPSTRHR
jgi:hypothetical protein